MAIWKFTNLNKHGMSRTRLVSTVKSLEIGKGFGPSILASRFKYSYKHPVFPPMLFTSPTDGKVYIVPTWQEVLPETTINDIEWIKPQTKNIKPTKLSKVVVKNISSNGKDEYLTTYYPETERYHCTCPGTWRTQGNCKHVKELRLKNTLQ